MNEQQFIKNNSTTWKELEKFSSRINKKGVKVLTSQEVKAFLHFFRVTSHHLAYARTHYPQSNVINYLNELITKCHSHVYAVKKVSPRALGKYLGYEFPALLKKYKWYLIGAVGVFTIGLIVGLLLVFYNENNSKLFLPPNILESMKQGKSGGGDWNDPLMSSQIMVNNITVALKAFVLGITLGIGTIYVLFFNGALLGALTAIVYMYGKPINYWSLILPHGVIELTAIFISGAAGLLVAKNILLPGEYSRWHGLINGAKSAVSLLFGVIVMLIVAGIIEGFFTPMKIPATSKLFFAAITAIVLIVYFSIPYFRKVEANV